MLIAFISPEVGFGVFARRAIKHGEIVAVYAGDFCVRDPNKKTAYIQSYFPDHDFAEIDAEKRGGVARFFQHLPFDLHRNFLTYKTLFENIKSLEILRF